MEGRQAVEAPGQRDIRHRALAGRVHERGAAFLQAPLQDVSREAGAGRFEEKVQLPNRHLQRARGFLRSQILVREVEADIAFRFDEPRFSDRLPMAAGSTAANDREQTAEIVGDLRGFRIVERLELSDSIAKYDRTMPLIPSRPDSRIRWGCSAAG